MAKLVTLIKRSTLDKSKKAEKREVESTFIPMDNAMKVNFKTIFLTGKEFCFGKHKSLIIRPDGYGL